MILRDRKYRRHGLLIPALAFVLPELAFAAGAGGHHGPNWWYVINFCAFFIPLFLIVRKPFNTFWLKRSRTIAAAVHAGEAEVAAAEKRLKQAEEQLEKVDADIAEIKTNIESQTANEAQEVATEAETQVGRIKQQAEMTAAAEARSFERDIQNELAQHVVETARQRLSDGSQADLDNARREAALQGVKLLVQ